MNYRDRLVAFYQKHNPAKLIEVDSILSTFAGREESMFAALQAKYEGVSGVEGRQLSPVEKEAAEVAGRNDLQAEMRELLREMESVDLSKLLLRLEGRTTVEGELLTHTLRFAQHLVTCARRFGELSSMMMATGVGATPREKTARGDAATQTRGIIFGGHDAATQTGVDDKKSSSTARDEMSYSNEVERFRAMTAPTAAPSSASSIPTSTGEEEREGELKRHCTIGTVHMLKPDKHKKTAIIEAILKKGVLSDADTITLQPGVYYENLCFVNSGNIELVAVFPGAPVIIKPLSNLEPVIWAEGAKTRMRVSGVVFAEDDTFENLDGGVSVSPNNPLIAVRDAASVDFYGCHFYHGSCAVEAAGAQTDVCLRLCVLSSCAFAGVFVHHGARADMTQCKVRLCETGVRVTSHSSVRLRETVLEENLTDGIVSYEGASGVLERSSVLRNGGNGIFLSSGSAFVVTESTIELNGLYGIQRFQGSRLHLRDSIVRDNAMLPVNDLHDAVDA